jgi:hypothetical protein
MSGYLSLIVMVLGLVLYFAFTKPEQPSMKIQECGRLMFAVGLLTYLLTTAPRVVSVLGGR